MRHATALLPGAREELHVAEFAAVHHQIVTSAELGELGISSSATSRWVACGRLRREHRGVFVYGGGQLSQVGRFYAALRAIGDDAVLSHLTAAVHHRFWPFEEPTVIHVSVPRQLRSRAAIRVHTVSELARESVTIWKGLRVTTPARTAIDLAGEPITVYQFGRSLHEAQVQTSLRIEQLEAELRRMPARFEGRKRLTAEIGLGPTRTRSDLEEWGVALLRRRHFPPFETNAHPPNTPAWVEVDVYFRRQRLAIEFYGNRYHRTRWRRPRDAEKRKLLRASGTEVLVLTDEDAAPDREEETVAKIRTVLLELG